MDSLLVFRSSLNCTYARSSNRFQFKNRNGIIPNRSFPFSIDRNTRSARFSRIICGASPATEEITREDGQETMKSKSASGGKALLKVRLDHQVRFGEHVVILGSTEELGSWKKSVPLNWSENGWVCDLELDGDDSVEYKFVIIRKDKSMLWEGGPNRVIKLPKKGVFSSVCRWNATDEALELLPMEEENEEEEEEKKGARNNGSFVEVVCQLILIIILISEHHLIR